PFLKRVKKITTLKFSLITSV
ncbi:PAS fold family protein, partial [Vibrio parahaemolyticus V-223/04]